MELRIGIMYKNQRTIYLLLGVKKMQKGYRITNRISIIIRPFSQRYYSCVINHEGHLLINLANIKLQVKFKNSKNEGD